MNKFLEKARSFRFTLRHAKMIFVTMVILLSILFPLLADLKVK